MSSTNTPTTSNPANAAGGSWATLPEELKIQILQYVIAEPSRNTPRYPAVHSRDYGLDPKYLLVNKAFGNLYLGLVARNFLFIDLHLDIPENLQSSQWGRSHMLKIFTTDKSDGFITTAFRLSQPHLSIIEILVDQRHINPKAKLFRGDRHIIALNPVKELMMLDFARLIEQDVANARVRIGHRISHHTLYQKACELTGRWAIKLQNLTPAMVSVHPSNNSDTTGLVLTNPLIHSPEDFYTFTNRDLSLIETTIRKENLTPDELLPATETLRRRFIMELIRRNAYWTQLGQLSLPLDLIKCQLQYHIYKYLGLAEYMLFRRNTTALDQKHPLTMTRGGLGVMTLSGETRWLDSMRVRLLRYGFPAYFAGLIGLALNVRTLFFIALVRASTVPPSNIPNRPQHWYWEMCKTEKWWSDAKRSAEEADMNYIDWEMQNIMNQVNIIVDTSYQKMRFEMQNWLPAGGPPIMQGESHFHRLPLSLVLSVFERVRKLEEMQFQ